MLATIMAQDEGSAAELRVAEVVGHLMEFWGFKAVMGRLWTVLYLSPDPLGAAELGERLALSTGAISMALADLQKWGVVKKTWRPGERRDFYEPETSIWKMVSRVFRERELTYVREATEAFEAALKQIGARRREATPVEKKRLKFIESRLDSLLTLARVGARPDPTCCCSGESGWTRLPSARCSKAQRRGLERCSSSSCAYSVAPTSTTRSCSGRSPRAGSTRAIGVFSRCSMSAPTPRP